MFSKFFVAREYERGFTFRVVFDGKTWDIDEHGALGRRTKARPNMKPLPRCTNMGEGGLENLIREATLIRAPQWKFGTDRLRVRSAVYSVERATMEKDEYHWHTLKSDVVCHDDDVERCLLERKWALGQGRYIRATTKVVADKGNRLVVDKTLTIDLDSRIVRNSLGNRGENLLVSMWYALKSTAVDQDGAARELVEDLHTVAENPNARIWAKLE